MGCISMALLGIVKYFPGLMRFCAGVQAMYGKVATNTTEGLPPSGMRVYVTTDAVLRQSFEATLAGVGR